MSLRSPKALKLVGRFTAPSVCILESNLEDTRGSRGEAAEELGRLQLLRITARVHAVMHACLG